MALGGVMAEYLGWFYYFLIAGTLISAACFVLYHLFDKVEQIVEIRDRAEAGEVETQPDDVANQTRETIGPSTT